VLSSADDPREVKLCHELGCNAYISKPVNYEVFVDAVKSLGMFISTLQVPELS
jgi:DNA-binding NarL/FixJ family response regulator